MQLAEEATAGGDQRCDSLFSYRGNNGTDFPLRRAACGPNEHTPREAFARAHRFALTRVHSGHSAADRSCAGAAKNWPAFSGNEREWTDEYFRTFCDGISKSETHANRSEVHANSM
jgi:hypothetical protein